MELHGPDAKHLVVGAKWASRKRTGLVLTRVEKGPGPSTVVTISHGTNCKTVMRTDHIDRKPFYVLVIYNVLVDDPWTADVYRLVDIGATYRKPTAKISPYLYLTRQ